MYFGSAMPGRRAWVRRAASPKKAAKGSYVSNDDNLWLCPITLLCTISCEQSATCCCKARTEKSQISEQYLLLKKFPKSPEFMIFGPTFLRFVLLVFIHIAIISMTIHWSFKATASWIRYYHNIQCTLYSRGSWFISNFYRSRKRRPLHLKILRLI